MRILPDTHSTTKTLRQKTADEHEADLLSFLIRSMENPFHSNKSGMLLPEGSQEGGEDVSAGGSYIRLV